MTANHRPFTLTARLQQGVALDVLFGTALDGLLASVVRERAKAEGAVSGTPLTGSMLDGGLNVTEPAVVELPLTRCTNQRPSTHPAHVADLSSPSDAINLDDPDWHWLCTTAYPVGFDGARTTADPDVHHQHSRIRESILPHIASPLPTSLPPASGRYRLRRLPVVTTPASAVQWQGVGDPDAIADLLTAIPSIGKRRHTGEGLVVGWNMETHLDIEPARWGRFGHCHPDGTLGRPIPMGCVERAGLNADRHGIAGIRPPYWHPATQRPVLLPDPL